MPKCLLEVGGLSLLERQLHALGRAGVRRVTVVIGHLADRVAAHLAGISLAPAVRLVVNPDYASTGGAASFLLGSLGVEDDQIYLIGDMLYEEEMVRRLARHSRRITMGVQLRPTAPEDMKVRLNGAAIVEVGKGIDPARASGEFVGAAYLPRASLGGLHDVFRRALASPAKQVYHFGDMMRELVSGGTEIGWADVTDLLWCEIDCVRDLYRARLRWKEVLGKYGASA